MLYYRNCAIRADLASVVRDYKDQLGDALSNVSTPIQNLAAAIQSLNDTANANSVTELKLSYNGFNLSQNKAVWCITDPGYTLNLTALLQENDILTVYDGPSASSPQLTGPLTFSSSYTGWRILRISQSKYLLNAWTPLVVSSDPSITSSGNISGGQILTGSPTFVPGDVGKKITINTAGVPSLNGTEYKINSFISDTIVGVEQMLDANPPTREDPLLVPTTAVSGISSFKLQRDSLWSINSTLVDCWYLQLDSAIPVDYSSYRNSGGYPFGEVRRIKKGIVVSTNQILSNGSGPSNIQQVVSSTNLADPSSGSDRSYWERRLERSNILMVNGKYIPSGNVDITGLKRLSVLIGCDINQISRYLSDAFTVVLTHMKSSTVTDTNCKPIPVTTTKVEESVIGVNISIAAAAALAGISESSVLVRFFWSGQPSFDTSTIRRISNLGISGSMLTAIASLQVRSDVEAYTIDPKTIIQDMKSGLYLTDADICELLTRSVHRIGLSLPGIASLQLTLGNIIDQSPVPLDGGGTVESPGLVMMAYLDPYTIFQAEASVTAALQSLGVDTNSTSTGNSINAQTVPTENQGCLALMAALDAGLLSLVTLTSVIQNSLGALCLDTTALSDLITGLFTTIIPCVKPTLPAASIQPDIGLGQFGMIAYMQQFSVVLAAMQPAKEAIDMVICGIQAFINALVGGVCGLEVGQLQDHCSEKVLDAFYRVQAALSIVGKLISKLFSSLLSATVQINNTFSLAFDSNLVAINCIPGATAQKLVQRSLGNLPDVIKLF